MDILSWRNYASSSQISFSICLQAHVILRQTTTYRPILTPTFLTSFDMQVQISWSLYVLSNLHNLCHLYLRCEVTMGSWSCESPTNFTVMFLPNFQPQRKLIQPSFSQFTSLITDHSISNKKCYPRLHSQYGGVVGSLHILWPPVMLPLFSRLPQVSTI